MSDLVLEERPVLRAGVVGELLAQLGDLLLEGGLALAQKVQAFLLLPGKGPLHDDLAGAHVDLDVVGMRDWVGRLDAVALAPLELALPSGLVLDGGREPLVVQALVGGLGGAQELGEEPLGAVLTLGGVDSKGADDGLGDRHGDAPLAVADLDGPVGLLEDDALEPLLVQPRDLVLRALRPPARVAGLAGPEAGLPGRLAVANLVARPAGQVLRECLLVVRLAHSAASTARAGGTQPQRICSASSLA